MARERLYIRRWNYERDQEVPEEKRRRRTGGRTLAVRPQFPLDEIYITLFSERRVYAPDGTIHYEPIPQRAADTGVELLDDLRRMLSEGKSNLKAFGEGYGLTPSDVNGLVLALTGMEAITFRIAWQMRRVDELLRYTDLSIEEVARQSGVGSTTNLFYACHRDFHCSPSQRRRHLRQANDLGRYR